MSISSRDRERVHEVQADQFVGHLRTIDVSPNGHAHTTRRRLRDKGIRFILETCRAMYSFAGKRRHLPPYAGNPFAELPLDRLPIEDAKRIFVFNATTELAFFQAADSWALPIHMVLAKTGIRVGELSVCAASGGNNTLGTSSCFSCKDCFCLKPVNSQGRHGPFGN